MKSVKKLLALVLAIAVVATFALPVFAEEEMTAAEKCDTLKIVKGDGSGVTEEYLAKTSARWQSAIIWLRLLGKEAEAVAYTGTATFIDGNDATWQGARNALAYLKANPDLGWGGYSDGSIKPNAATTAQEFYKVMLEGLGYKQNVDFAWSEVIGFAKAKGFAAAVNASPFTNDDMCEALVEALGMNLKGDDETTLLEKLITDGVIAKADAVAAGLMEADAPFGVVSASGTNLKEIVVGFNEALDEDTVVKANFTVDGDEAASVALSDDGKVVTVTIANASATNGADYDLVVKKAVTNTAGVALAADYTGTVRIIDNTVPAASAVELTGPKTFKITFSEPIKTAGTVKVNNGIYGCTVGAVGTSSVTVTLAASTLPNGSYDITIKGFKDYAGFAMDDTTLDLDYTKDTTEPTATITDATQTQVVVEFNKPVTLDDATGTIESYFYHTFSAWKPAAVTVSADRTTYTLDFSNFYVPAGSTSLVIKYKNDGAVQIVDDWGNKLSANISIPFDVTADHTAPTITDKEVVSEKVVELYFSEDIDKTIAEDEDNYTIKDSDGDAVTTAFTCAYTEDAADSEYKVTITFAAKLTGGNYTVEVSNIEDESLYANVMADAVVDFAITDLTAVDTTDAAAVTVAYIPGAAAADGEVIYVRFPEAMATTGQYSVLAASNYLLDLDGAGAGAAVALDDDATIASFGATGKVVKIWIPDAAIVANTSQLIIGRVSDTAGNTTVVLSFAEVITAEAAPAVTKVEQTDSNKLTITVNSILSEFLPDAFVGSDGVVLDYDVIASIDSMEFDGTTTIVKVTLTADYVDACEAELANYATDTSILADGGDMAVTIDGEFIVAETGKAAADGAAVAFTDKRAPELVDITVDDVNDEIDLEFSEALDDSVAVAAFAAQDLVIKNADGDTLVAGIDYGTIIVGDTITVQGLAAGDYTVASKSSIAYIMDDTASANKAEAFTTAEEVTIN